MNTRTLIFSLLMAGFILPTVLCAQAENREADQKAIQDSIVGYVAALNKGDAVAAATFWSENGVWMAPDGKEILGRQAIAEHMSATFSADTMPKIELLDVRVRFIAANVATEEGHVVMTSPGEAPQKASYISIHVKTDQGWKLDSVRETVIADTLSNYHYLAELEWMVGTWREQTDDVTVETTCEWTSNQNFLLRTFKMTRGGEVELEGTQVVGWDALQQRIRSWVFDSDGGFGSGLWRREGSTWIIDASFQTADGVLGSSENRFTLLDNNRFSYDSTQRMLGGEPQPDIQGLDILRVIDDAATTEEAND